MGLRERGLVGVEFVLADDHAGLKASIREVLPEAAYQRCYMGLLKNPHGRDSLINIVWLGNRRGNQMLGSKERGQLELFVSGSVRQWFAFLVPHSKIFSRPPRMRYAFVKNGGRHYAKS